MSVDITIRENKYNLKLNDLIILGKRINNNKRNFLFISKVLGKHIEAKPSVCKEVGHMLASLIYGEKQEKAPYNTMKNVCVLGFAETATGLGMAVASAIKDSYYITTTREDITEIESILKFEEEHSHATIHKCFPLENIKLINAEKIILVDDEITTGKSMINIIKELRKITKAREFTILSILDWRNEEHKNMYKELSLNENIQVEILSLISGDIKVNDLRMYIDNDDIELREKANITNISGLERITLKTRLKSEGESFIASTGRFGVSFSEIEKLEDKCKDIAKKIEGTIDLKNKRVLVLGHGENIYIPCRIASYLHGDIYFKSTTRSPIYSEDNENYPIKEKHVFYHKGVKYYFYNKSEIEKKYDRVILITEDDLNIKLTNNTIIVRV